MYPKVCSSACAARPLPPAEDDMAHEPGLSMFGADPGVEDIVTTVERKKGSTLCKIERPSINTTNLATAILYLFRGTGEGDHPPTQISSPVPHHAQSDDPRPPPLLGHWGSRSPLFIDLFPSASGGYGQDPAEQQESKPKTTPPSAEHSTSSAEGGISSHRESKRNFWGTGEEKTRQDRSSSPVPQEMAEQNCGENESRRPCEQDHDDVLNGISPLVLQDIQSHLQD
ncbi:hypothetical protein MMC27_007204 [Xylographa pallens]|nr:hypothetical protein [Xylographa pallens]